MSRRNSDFDKIIDFMKEIEKFKMVERKIPLSSLKRNENDAEHSWHLAMFILLLEDKIPKKVNVLKMMKLALVHDLGEMYVGDVSLFDAKGREGKEEREMKSARRLFSRLPKKLEKEMMKLIIEYNEGKTHEAKFVKSLDKLQATIQYISSKSPKMVKHGITYNLVDEKKRPYMLHNKKILKLHEIVMAEAKKRKLFASED